MDRVRRRIADKRVLALVKAFLKSGILDEDGRLRDNDTGTPQGSILSPLLSNVALSVLDEFVAQEPGGPQTGPVERAKRRRHGLPNHRLIRYADDWCLVISGSRSDAEALKEKITGVLATMGLRLSPDKTLITHIDQGLDFLGWRIQRHRKRGSNRHYVYTYPAKKALRAVTGKVKTLCRQVGTDQSLDALLLRLNPVVRGWCGYFRPGVSYATFAYLGHYLWFRVWHWLRRKHPKDHLEGHPPPLLPRRIMAGQPQPGTAQPHHGRHQPLPLPGRSHPDTLAGHRIPSPASPPGTYGEPVAVKAARRVREAVRGNGPVERPEPRLGPTSQRSPAASTRSARPLPYDPFPTAHNRDPQRPTTRPARRADPRVSAGRMRCAEFLAPTGELNASGWERPSGETHAGPYRCAERLQRTARAPHGAWPRCPWTDPE